VGGGGGALFQNLFAYLVEIESFGRIKNTLHIMSKNLVTNS
jgi:hypothetical protein